MKWKNNAVFFKVCLTLTNKFTVTVSSQKLTMDRLFVKTKQLIMIVLPCSNGDNLIGCLKSKTLLYQEEQYWDLIAKKEKADQTAQNNASMIDHTNLFKVGFCFLDVIFRISIFIFKCIYIFFFFVFIGRWRTFEFGSN